MEMNKLKKILEFIKLYRGIIIICAVLISSVIFYIYASNYESPKCVLEGCENEQYGDSKYCYFHKKYGPLGFDSPKWKEECEKSREARKSLDEYRKLTSKSSTGKNNTSSNNKTSSTNSGNYKKSNKTKTHKTYNVYGDDAYDVGYEDIYLDDDYDEDRYYRDSDYAAGVDDAMEDVDW